MEPRSICRVSLFLIMRYLLNWSLLPLQRFEPLKSTLIHMHITMSHINFVMNDMCGMSDLSDLRLQIYHDGIIVRYWLWHGQYEPMCDFIKILAQCFSFYIISKQLLSVELNATLSERACIKSDQITCREPPDTKWGSVAGATHTKMLC